MPDSFGSFENGTQVPLPLGNEAFFFSFQGLKKDVFVLGDHKCPTGVLQKYGLTDFWQEGESAMFRNMETGTWWMGNHYTAEGSWIFHGLATDLKYQHMENLRRCKCEYTLKGNKVPSLLENVYFLYSLHWPFKDLDDCP